MRSITILLTAAVIAFVAGTNTTYAYVTTDQHAFSLDGRTGIFLIDFTFGHEDHDVYIPLVALPGTKTNERVLSYQIYDDEDEAAKGTTAGIVLSHARLENGMYRIPKGSSALFTLFVAYTPNEYETDTEFRTQVTHLPFSFDGVTDLSLNPSELGHYVTPELKLTDGPRIAVNNIAVTVSEDSDPGALTVTTDGVGVTVNQ